jgi:hypothetical protein
MASFREQLSSDRFEKRRIPRFPVQLPADIGSEESDTSTICTNLSSEGLSMETARPLTVGERIAVRVVISPQEQPLRMLGQVIWKREIGAVDTSERQVHEVGVRFLKPLPTPWKMPVDPELTIDTLDEEVPEVIPFRRL